MNPTRSAALIALATIALAAVLCSCAKPEKSPDASRPTSPAAVVVADSAPAPPSDGFPTGQDSPEGAACDMARAFINVDSALFRKVCYAGENRTPNDQKYSAFMDQMASQIDYVKTLPKGKGGGPKSIGRVYKVRELSHEGPASAGFAIYQFSETKFVDVVTPMWNEPDFTTRTLVVQDEHTHLWYTIPRPDLFPFLSMGLNQETDSTELWTPSTATPSSASTPAAASGAFPSGQSIPEGVACDLAQSFIRSDSELFHKCCYVITPGTPERDAYNNYIDDTVMKMDVAKSSPKSEGGRPTAILKVYRARPLSKDGPAKFALDQLGLISVRFVDLQLAIRNGTTETRRTLVVQDEGSKLWFAVPHPENFPQLSDGLTTESDSTDLWKPPMP